DSMPETVFLSNMAGKIFGLVSGDDRLAVTLEYITIPPGGNGGKGGSGGGGAKLQDYSRIPGGDGGTGQITGGGRGGGGGGGALYVGSGTGGAGSGGSITQSSNTSLGRGGRGGNYYEFDDNW